MIRLAQRGITKNSLTSDISAEHFAALFKSLYAMSGICKAFDSLACTKVDNNTVRLASGIYSLSGYMVMVDPGTTEDLTIDSGTSGQNRNDLVVAEFVRHGNGTGADILHFTIVKGTSTSGTATDPILTQQDINAAGVTRQEALYRVKIAGIDITSIERVAPLIETDLTSHKADMVTQLGLKADKHWGSWTDLTLQNGFTGSIKVRKNISLQMVEIDIKVKTPANVNNYQLIVDLPVEYRPIDTTYPIAILASNTDVKYLYGDRAAIYTRETHGLSPSSNYNTTYIYKTIN